MPTVHLKKPYKILHHKLKQYSLHYSIPADNCVVIPVRFSGEDVACDVRWVDSDGAHHIKDQLLFTPQNLEPVNEMNNYALFELWQQYDKTDQK
jgi:hypothetical protein